jgi:hypothetical protein
MRWSHRILFIFAILAVTIGTMGCATTDPNADSDIPWNAPQPWEGAPGIPGLDGR